MNFTALLAEPPRPQAKILARRPPARFTEHHQTYCMSSPYAVNLEADALRRREEALVRSKLAGRLRRSQTRGVEQVREHCVQLAMEDMQQLPRPKQKKQQLESEHRHLASLAVMRAEERHAAIANDYRRRGMHEQQPGVVLRASIDDVHTAAVREQREVDFLRRRADHQLQRHVRLSRLAQQEAEQRASLAAISDAKIAQARGRASQLLKSSASTSSVSGAAMTASAPTLLGTRQGENTS